MGKIGVLNVNVKRDSRKWKVGSGTGERGQSKETKTEA